eukprot:9385073-Pyramimonas_sp.AAC.1
MVREQPRHRVVGADPAASTRHSLEARPAGKPEQKNREHGPARRHSGTISRSSSMGCPADDSRRIHRQL